MTDETTNTETTPEESLLTKETETSEKTTSEEEPKTTEEIETEEKEEESSEEEEFVPLTTEDITIPEGLEVDEKAQSTFLDILNKTAQGEKTLDAAAQELVDLQASLAQRAAESHGQAWETLQEEWTEAAKNHAEFGGANFQANVALVKQAVTEFASSKEEEGRILDALGITGAGNHPDILNFIHKMAKVSVKEGVPTPGSPAHEPLTLADRMFPNQGKS